MQAVRRLLLRIILLTLFLTVNAMNNDLIQFILTAFSMLLVVINPLAVSPVFVAVTANLSAAQRRATLTRAILSAFGVALFFLFVGRAFLGMDCFTMFRRIELISEMGATEHRNMIDAMLQSGEPIFDRELMRFWKFGLMSYSNETINNAWVKLNNPRRDIFKNCRFFFTEAGWRRYGRPTVAAYQQTGQLYRVLSIKEKSVDVVYRDEFQVAVRPKKNNRKATTSS